MRSTTLLVDHEHERRNLLDRELLEQSADARPHRRVELGGDRAPSAATCARRLSMRRAGPEVERVKKTSIGSGGDPTESSSPLRERTKLHSAPHARALADRHRRGHRRRARSRRGGSCSRARPARRSLAAAVALVAGGVIGWLVFDWKAVSSAPSPVRSAASARERFARGAVRRGGTAGRNGRDPRRRRGARSRAVLHPDRRLHRGNCDPRVRACVSATRRARSTPGSARLRSKRAAILIVIDGLTPSTVRERRRRPFRADALARSPTRARTAARSRRSRR